MTKKICALFLLFAALSVNVVFAVPANEKILNMSVVDEPNLMSQSEIKSLTDKIKTIETKYNIRVGIEFLNSIGNSDVESAARYLLNQRYGDGQNGGILLLVDMGNRKWQIVTDAKLQQVIPNPNDIAGGFVNKLSSGDYYGACAGYLEGIDQFCGYYAKNGAAYDSSSGFNPMAAVMAVLIAILCGIGVRSWLIGSMSNVRHEVAASDYLKRDTVKLTKNRDTYLFTNVSRRPKPRPSSGRSGGGSSGGGGGSAGGSF